MPVKQVAPQAGPPARYEFRIWGRNLRAVADRLLAGAPPPEVRETEERYILPARPCGVNVKLRDGRLQVKQLQAVEDELERWTMVLDMEFPLPAVAIRAEALPLLGAPGVPALPDPCSEQEFLAALARLETPPIVVAVRKIRRLVCYGGVRSEVTGVSFAAASRQTIALESADAAAVRAAIAQLGVAGRKNMSYDAAIRQLIG